MNIQSKIKKGENSTIDIIGEISTEDFATYRDQAIKNAGKDIEIKGFRKGSAPAEMIEKQVGPMAILDEMAHLAVADAYPKLLEEHKIQAIGQPAVNITKLATGNPLGFTITTSVMPEIKLADYKKIAKKEMGKKEDTDVTDKEVEDAIMHIKRMRAQHEQAQNTKEGDPTTPEASRDKDLPELTDEFVKSLGSFENVADFKNKLRENMEQEKKAKEMEKKQIATMDAIVEKTKMDVPKMLIDFELEKMFGQLEHDIAMTGMSFDDYLNKIEKTRDDLRRDWAESAEKRAKMQLIINEIAQTENLTPDEKKIEEEVAKTMEQYKDMKGINENSVRAYVASILTNQEVFKFLEAQK